jgi:hypothetical protein
MNTDGHSLRGQTNGGLVYVHPWPILLVVMVAALLGSTPAEAHNLLIDCHVTDGKLRVEAYYDTTSKPPAENARIVVAKESGELIAEGRTDDRGIWSCPAPADGEYIVTAETLGHKSDPFALAVGAPARQAEQPGIPWLRIGIGLGVIALLSAGWWFSRRKRLSPNSS